MVRDTLKQRAHELASASSRDELIWLSGYLAGLANEALELPSFQPPPVAEKAEPKPFTGTITLLYGTETGNAKKAALDAAATIRQRGHKVKCLAVEQYKPEQLSREELLLVAISTQGDGEPPAAAKNWYDYLHQQSPDLSGLAFSVLALGSRAYPLFCQTGIEVDQRLAALGGRRLVPVVTCDEDFEADARQWLSSVLDSLAPANKATLPEPEATPVAAKPAAKSKQTATAVVSTNLLLNDAGSRREVYHLELALQQDFTYTPGDAVGLVPHNKAAVVQQIIALGGLPANTSITWKEETATLEHLLTTRLNLVHLPLRAIKKYATLTGQDIPDTRMDLYDLLRIYPVKDAAQFLEVVQGLDAMAPRLYTLSSSPEAHPGELHLTVLRLPVEDTSDHAGQGPVYGLCSDYLSRLEPGTVVEVFLHKHKHFQLPGDDAHILMIGPGTGIAPFRAFLAHREATGAGGRNWLLFGESDFVTDFYYQTELQAWYETGVLHRIDLAWENAVSGPRWVQDILLEQAADVWQWLEQGGQVFVSGDKEPMSREVEKALLQVIATQGSQTPEQAAAYLKQLTKEGRYAKDVY